ncbi:MAG: efflux RND transporter periplasmic adaptor subunit [Planctomycetota bacterium]
MSQVILRLTLFVLTVGIPFSRTPAETIEVDSVLIRVIDEVEIPARATGAIRELLLREGSVVVRNQLLARLDDTEADLALRRAQSELEIASHLADDDVAVRAAEKKQRFAASDFGRLSKARQSQPRSVSESELERSRLESEQAVLDVEKASSEQQAAVIRQTLALRDVAIAQRNVEIRQVTAPIDGVIVEVNRQAGEWVQPGDVLFRVVRTDRLRAEGFIRASDAVRGLENCRAVLSPIDGDSSLPSHSGEITFVSPEIDPINGQVRIWADFDNSDGRLRPGWRARMTIETEHGE